MKGAAASTTRPSTFQPGGAYPEGRGRLGIIGGSGLYRMAAPADAIWTPVDTAWGRPSDAILVGTLAGREIAFLPRHGRGHVLAPHEIPIRANIAAFKALGCDEVIAISAVGSFREELPPGTFVIVDQYVDRTIRDGRSYFGDGVVAHVAFADPACSRLAGQVAAALATLGLHADAVIPGCRVLLVDDLIATDGTALAAIRLLRKAGAEVVGAAFVIDLSDIGGARLIADAGVPVGALIAFEGH